MEKVGYARISHSTVTDTELQLGKFKLWDENVNYDPLFDNYDFIDESVVVESNRFSSNFRGKGIRGHRFHMFKIPIYYKEIM